MHRGILVIYGQTPADFSDSIQSYQAMYPQQTAMDENDDHLTVYEKISKHSTQATELIRKWGLTEYAGKKLAAIDREIYDFVTLLVLSLFNASIYVMNKPTEGMSEKLKWDTRGLIMTMKRDGATIILSTTTDIECESDFADYLMIMKDNQVVDEGRPKDLQVKYRQDEYYLEYLSGEGGYLAVDQLKDSEYLNEELMFIEGPTPTIKKLLEIVISQESARR